MMAMMPTAAQTDVASREALLAEVNRPEAVAQREQMTAMLEMLDNEDVAPSKGLDVSTLEFTSTSGRQHGEDPVHPPAGRRRRCRACTTSTAAAWPAMSCFDGMYRSWGRIIANQGVAVAMVDFRNCLTPSSAPEVAPFPAGLDDCVSGLRFVVAQRRRPGHRPGPRRRRRRERRREPDAGDRPAARPRRRHGAHPRALRAVPVHRRVVAAGPLPVLDREQRPAHRPAQQPRCRSPTASRSSTPATRWRGRCSPPRTTSRTSRRRSSASTSAIRCATRASSSTACCCAPASGPAAAR